MNIQSAHFASLDMLSGVYAGVIEGFSQESSSRARCPAIQWSNGGTSSLVLGWPNSMDAKALKNFLSNLRLPPGKRKLEHEVP